MKALWVAALLALNVGFAQAAPFNKVIVVIFENASYQDAMRQPFFKEFASRGALLTNYHAIGHPSQPNYIAMVSGTSDGVDGDSAVDLDRRHLGDLLETNGRNWKVYAEGYPGSCFLGSHHGRYVRRHVPFVSFKDVQTDPARCARIVDASQLDADLASGSMPDFALYVPDVDNDGHDTGVEFAGKWFERRFRPLLENPAFAQSVLLVATFDEDDWTGGNRIYTAVVGPGIRPGSESNAALTHYSLLRTIEDSFGLGTLGREDASAAAFSALWAPPELSRP